MINLGMNLTIEQVMRANAVMAGIAALASHYPRFVPLEARPTPATDYLYETVVIASMQGAKHAKDGLGDFFANIMTDLLEKRILPTNAKLPAKGDAAKLRSLRALFKKGVVDPSRLSAVADAWVAPVGKLDDVDLAFALRQNVSEAAESFVRTGVVKLVRTMQLLNLAEYDWWHELGVAISYFAYGYMANEWENLPTLQDPFDRNLDSEAKEAAFVALKASREEFAIAHWACQEKLFVALADCIGKRAGKAPRVPKVAGAARV